jgi:sphingolipid delta-4 desaturase
VALNMGYHEHHDLPSIPWNNLPAAVDGAGFYSNLKYHFRGADCSFSFFSTYTASIRESAN